MLLILRLTLCFSLIASIGITASPLHAETAEEIEDLLGQLSHSNLTGGKPLKPTSLQLSGIENFIKLYEDEEELSPSDRAKRQEMRENLLLGLRSVDRLEASGGVLKKRMEQLSLMFAYALENLLKAKQGNQDQSAIRSRTAQLQDILAEVYLVAASNVSRRIMLFNVQYLESGLVGGVSGYAAWLLEKSDHPHLAEVSGTVAALAIANIGINVYRGTQKGADPLLVTKSVTKNIREEVADEVTKIFINETADMMAQILPRFAPKKFRTFGERLEWLDDYIPQTDLEKDCNALLAAP